MSLRSMICAVGLCAVVFATSAHASTVLPYNGSGLRLWLQADEGLNLDPGPANINRVLGWADTTGFGGNNVAEDGVGPSGNRPLFVDNVLNGEGVVRFNAGNRRIDGPTIAGLSGGNDKTIIVVARSASVAAGNGNRIIFDPNGQGATPNGAVVRITPEMNIRYGNGFTDAGGQLSDSSFEIISVQTGLTHQETEIIRNNVLSTGASNNPTNTLNTGTAGYTLGGKLNAGNTHWQGDIAEVIVFDEHLSFNQQQLIGQYLAEKYALDVTFNPIPEPATATLALLGVAGLARRRRRVA